MLKNIQDLVRIIVSGIRDPREIYGEVGIYGYVELEVHDKNGKLIHKEEGENVVLDRGKEEIMYLLRDNVWGLGGDREIAGTVKSIARLAVGDGGADPGSLLTPKTLDKTRTTLFYEVWRQDVTSMAHPTSHSLRTTTDVLSAGVATASFNPANGGYYANEAGLVISRPGHFITSVPEAGEILFTHKTFKSFPFDPTLAITATFKWTIYIVL